MSRTIIFIGSRGIPGKYGGTETFVEEVSRMLVQEGFKVYVTCESDKFFEDNYMGVIRIHVPSIQGKSLTIPSLNDLIATIRALKLHSNEIDVFYYVAPDGALPSIIAKLARKKVLINPDGIEWKRLIKRINFVPDYLYPLYLIAMLYMRFMEYLSCKLPDIVIADSVGIKKYLEKNYAPRRVVYIPYGARKLLSSEFSEHEEKGILNKFGLQPREYYLTVARIVAENNIHIEIEGFKKSDSNKKLVIVGNFDKKDPYTRHLLKLKGNTENILFIDSIYDKNTLGVLRKNCFAYIHAYEVGGTNPSLLEQMQFKRPILAYDVPFNREVLQESGIYFKNPLDLSLKIRAMEHGNIELKNIIKAELKRIKKTYNWKTILKAYKILLGEFQ